MPRWGADRIALAVLYLTWGGWLFSFPARLGQDDSLYFARGLAQFSILDFSPHFPGYPVFILAGRLIGLVWSDQTQALFLLSLLGCLALPPLAARAAVRFGGDGRIAFILALSQPILAGLGPAMLSDGVGLALILAALAWGRWAWIWLGLAVLARPSNLVLILAVGLVQHGWRSYAWLGVAGLVGVGFGGVWLLEGPGLIEEGGRFISGHFFGWGNTALTERKTTWAQAVWQSPGLSLVMAGSVLAAWRFWPFWAVLAWVMVGQNPHHLRHLAPLVLIGLMMAADRGRLAGLAAALILAGGVWGWRGVDFRPGDPPLARAFDDLQGLPAGTVVTHHGVALFRQWGCRHRLVDAAYGGQAQAAMHLGPFPVYQVAVCQGGRWRGRFPGEQDLCLFTAIGP